jgi:hypothetical protein
MPVFRTRSPVTTPDIDGWHARDLIAPLFFNDNTELHHLIRRRLILPYLTGSFHSSFIEEYAGGLLMALQKPDGGIRPILCGEVWRRCFASLPLMPRLSAMRRLSYLLLPMITIALFKLQVFGMVLRTARRYYQYSMITLILQTLTIRM